jgi:GNAT superfamily N-acetyltransferase
MTTTCKDEVPMTTDLIDRQAPCAPPGDVRIASLRAGGPTAAWVARLHVSELPHGLLPQLGPTFVRRWHRAHLESPHGVGFVALHEGRPVGFALGSTDRRANVHWLVTHRRRALMWSGARALVARPRLLAGFLLTRSGRYGRRLFARSSGSPIASTTPPLAVLEAIVVQHDARGRGIGRRLVEAFLEEALDAGVDEAELVTKDTPNGAAGFYERGRWTRVGSHIDRDGDTVLRYRIDTVQLRPR